MNFFYINKLILKNWSIKFTIYFTIPLDKRKLFAAILFYNSVLRFSILIHSTSKTRAESGGIVGGEPFAP